MCSAYKLFKLNIKKYLVLLVIFISLIFVHGYEGLLEVHEIRENEIIYNCIIGKQKQTMFRKLNLQKSTCFLSHRYSNIIQQLSQHVIVKIRHVELTIQFLHKAHLHLLSNICSFLNSGKFKSLYWI